MQDGVTENRQDQEGPGFDLLLFVGLLEKAYNLTSTGLGSQGNLMSWMVKHERVDWFGGKWKNHYAEIKKLGEFLYLLVLLFSLVHYIAYPFL